MPNWKVHRLIDRIFLGKEYPEVHKFLDMPFGLKLGKGHRKYFGHDIKSLAILYLLTKDIKILKSGILHQITDRIIRYDLSDLIEKLFKKKY